MLFLQRGYLACLYVISFLSILEATSSARSTSFLHVASAVWGSTSTNPTSPPTSNPLHSKSRRLSKRRRKVSTQIHKSRIQNDGGMDNCKPKKRKRKRKRSRVSENDRSGSIKYSQTVGSAPGSTMSANRPISRSASTSNKKKTKRRRSPLGTNSKQSSETSVRKNKKSARRTSSVSISDPPEVSKDDSEVSPRKKRRSKRRKHPIVGKEESPKFSPVKGATSTKSKKVKRTKKRRLVSSTEPEMSEIRIPYAECDTESEEIRGPSLSSPRILTHNEIDVDSPPEDQMKDEPQVAVSDENSVVNGKNWTPIVHPDDSEESTREQLSIYEEQDNPRAFTNEKRQYDISATADEIEPNTTISPPNDDIAANTSSDHIEGAIAEASNVSADANTVGEEEDDSSDEAMSANVTRKLDGMTDSSANVENEFSDKEEPDQKQEELYGTSIEDGISEQSRVPSITIPKESQIKSQSPLKVASPEETFGKQTVVTKEHEIDEDVVEENEGDSGGIHGNAKKEDGVVDFIEDILQEDVKSWVDESSSSSDTGTKPTSILNATRGGHQTSTDSEMKNDETNPSKFEDSSIARVRKGGQAENWAEDSTAETHSLDPLVLESTEDCETDLAVSVVTWNLAEISPAEEDAAFIRKFRKTGVKKGSGSDLVLISGQECENIKPRRSEGSRSREYRRLMIKMLGKQYVPIALHLLGGIQFGLFAKRSFLKEIEEISIADVTCGIGNVFHNKGAIAAFLKVKARNPTSKGKKAKSLRMVFVTAHMAAHVKNVDARNSDFWRISSELEAQAPDGFLPEHDVPAGGQDNESFLFNSVDRVFFCGDLNYRVDLPREFAEFEIVEKGRNEENELLYVELMYHDQLKAAMCENHAFPGFAEGRIGFAPTFKFDKETGSYDTSHKQRIPAWTDRILFKPFGTRVLEYTSVPEAQHSDHRPVYATFRVSMEGRDLPTKKSRTRKYRERNTYKEME